MSFPRMVALLSLVFLPLISGQELDSRVSETEYRQRLLDTVALWDGGLDGQTGMGAYRTNWDGLFRTDMSRSFVSTNPNRAQTLISQSRAIYINVEAFREAQGAAKERFRAIVQKGADYLISHSWDPVYGGLFWELAANGTVPPGDTSKQAYGQVHVIFSLAHAYAITGDPDHLAFAWQVHQQFLEKNADPGYPGAYRPNMNRSYTVETTDNNFDYMLHYFETLQALFDVTSGSQHEQVRATLAELGAFITGMIVQPLGADEAFVSYWYGSDWSLHPTAYSPSNYWNPARFATSGHGIELAWLLSRAVERGFDPAWLDTSRKLLNFSRRHSINPNAGGLVYDRLDTQGRVIPGELAVSNIAWWPQAEAARAMLNASVLRGANEWAAFSSTKSFIDQRFVDPLYGGWYETLSVSNPSLTGPTLNTTPVLVEKGHIWKVNYHVTMYYAEILRLFRLQDPQVASGLAFTDHERETHASRAGPMGDFDLDGMSNFIEYALGSDARSPEGPGGYRTFWDAENRRVGLRYSVSATALGVEIEPIWSSDLEIWSTEGLEPQVVSSDGQRTVYQVWRDAGDGAAFLRLRVR